MVDQVRIMTMGRREFLGTGVAFPLGAVYGAVTCDSAGVASSNGIPTPGTRAPITNTDPHDFAGKLTAASDASLVGFRAPRSSQTVTVESKLNQIVSLFDYMSPSQRAQSLACKLLTDPAPDMTAVLQGLINAASGTLKLEVPSPVSISSTITIPDGTNIHFYSPNGFPQIPAGGVLHYTGGVFRWMGAPNSVMFLLDTVSGSRFDGLFFETASNDRQTILISGVTFLRFINNGASHFNQIENCYFSRCQYAIHYYDTGRASVNDQNLDSQTIINCGFDSYEDALRVEQTNVYDSTAYRCSFFGSGYYAKHHVHIVKGHYNIDGCFFGGLHDGSHYGGVKDAIAVYIERGYVNITNCHSEIKNAPFIDWVEIIENGDTVNVFGLEDQTETKSNWVSHEIINRTNNVMNIIGGSLTGTVNQAGSNGQINLIGVSGVGTADSTSVPDRVWYSGARRNSGLGAFGTLPNGTGVGLGGGQATLEGNDPALTIFDRRDNTSGIIKYTGGLLQFNKGGVTNGPFIDFTKKYLDLSNPKFMYRSAIYTVATLPPAADGLRAFVSDSTAAAAGNFGAAVAGGGANTVPVYCAGGWKIG
jgi:hypothetical protein